MLSPINYRKQLNDIIIISLKQIHNYIKSQRIKGIPIEGVKTVGKKKNFSPRILCMLIGVACVV